MISWIFDNFFSNDEKSQGSKARTGSYGRKSDGDLKDAYKDLEQQLLHLEIKSPNAVSEDSDHYPNFVKLYITLYRINSFIFILSNTTFAHSLFLFF